MKIERLNDGMQLGVSREELVWIMVALDDELEKHIGFLEFHSDEGNKEFFEERGINITEKIENHKAKVEKLQQMLKDING